MGPLVTEGNAAHRVGDMPIETGEEAKAMLTGEEAGRALHIGADRIVTSNRYRDAPRLATAQLGLTLEHGDTESSFYQLMCGAHPGHPTTEHRNLRPVTGALERADLLRCHLSHPSRGVEASDSATRPTLALFAAYWPCP